MTDQAVAGQITQSLVLGELSTTNLTGVIKIDDIHSTLFSTQLIGEIESTYVTGVIDTTVVGQFTPKTETHRGSDLTSSFPSTGRVLTMDNTQKTLSDAIFIIVINKASLVPTEEYTVNHLNSNSTVTFNVPVPDVAYITIYYFI